MNSDFSIPNKVSTKNSQQRALQPVLNKSSPFNSTDSGWQDLFLDNNQGANQSIMSTVEPKTETPVSSSSHPSTPSQHEGAQRESTTPPRDIKQDVPNGTLTPSQASHSGSASRRASGLPDNFNSADQQRFAANRRSLNGNFDDLTSAFGQLDVDSKKSTPDNVRTSAAPNDNRPTAQQSLLQRALGRDAHPAHSVGTGEGGNMTPSFNERFLFTDDDLEDDSTFVKKYNLNEDDTSFPVLIRRDSQPSLLSASSAALDLAPLSQTPPRFPPRNGNANVSEWPQFSGNEGEKTDGPEGNSNYEGFNQRRGRSERNSPQMGSSVHGIRLTTAPGTPVGGSRNESSNIPRSATAGHFGGNSPASNRLQGFGSTENGTDDRMRKEQQSRSRVQDKEAGFAPFGPFGGDINHGVAASNAFAPYGFDSRSGSASDVNRASQGFFEAFAAPPLSKAGGNGQKPPALGSASSGGATYGFGLGHEPNRLGNSPVGAAATGMNGMKLPRKGELDASTPLEDLQGEIFALCKDQHGCRYLQKKLEEGNAAHRDMIFTETFSHFAELMTDPFGNYLCQKMLEFCTDEQRNLIVESVAPDLVTISLNMHGTRAVQKTIDCLSTARQIHSIIMALSMNVVPLIKDLNGNHVIQKCLNRLSSTDNQFIYDAVATHCVEVATHRHGCCVLQRCIDHASDNQRMQLVQEITFHALTLVQDPFGNYVVQYILDLNDARCSDAIVRQFVGHVCNLSVQKFSSNVIEKCIRVSEPSLRKQLIEELLNRTRLEKLLRDSFANYVVQTSLDYADPVQRMQLVDCIKPILPMIRNTPYGKRIQSKLQRENIDLGPTPGNVPYGLLQAAHQQQQLQAMAAMAQRQGHNGDFSATAAAMSGRPYNNMQGPSLHAPGNNGNRGYGRGGVPAIGPHSVYNNSRGGGPFGAPGGSPGSAAMFNANAGGGSGGASAAYGRGNNHIPPPHLASSSPHMGFPPQQPFGMPSGFGPGVPTHPSGGAPFTNPYGGQF